MPALPRNATLQALPQFSRQIYADFARIFLKELWQGSQSHGGERCGKACHGWNPGHIRRLLPNGIDDSQ
jgi:hypothetical protein